MRKNRAIFLLVGLFGLSACASVSRQQALSRDSLSPSEHATLGNTYLAEGEKAAAIQQYEAAVAEDPRQIQSLVALGNIAYEAHDWKKARDYFQRALRKAPENAAVINNLAMVDLAEGKNLERSRRALEKALPTAGPLAPYLLDTLSQIKIALQSSAKKRTS